MLNVKKFHAVGMMAARNAREKAATAAANDVISMTALLKEWHEGAYNVGDVVAESGYPYKCIQAHDSTGNPAWNPQANPALFAPYHATAKEYALPWRAPTHAGDAYNKGEWMIWEGGAYECQTDATIYAPDVLPAAWHKA